MASGGGRRRRQRQPKPRARAKARGKAKRTKYLSLSDLMVKAEEVVPATPPTPTPGDEPASPRSPWEEEEEAEVKAEEDVGGDGGAGRRQQQQVEPFALHHYNEASTLFEPLPAPSLSDILGPSPSASRDGASSGNSGLPGAQEEDLARRALRGRERWVYCSSPAATPTATATATATTSSSSPCSSAASTGASARPLLLKLDYEEILAAWADRGSLYIGAGESPDLQLDAVQVLVAVEPSEHAVAAPSGRAERVRRYKEKRRRRLFAKRIRYEVRRVNAVKRPRFKGRFIKEHEESELRPT